MLNFFLAQTKVQTVLNFEIVKMVGFLEDIEAVMKSFKGKMWVVGEDLYD